MAFNRWKNKISSTRKSEKNLNDCYYEVYLEGARMTKIPDSEKASMAVGGVPRNLDYVNQNNATKVLEEVLLVKVQLFSKHKYCGNVLIFSLVVWLDPESSKVYEEPGNQSIQSIGKECLVVLKARNENINISLLKYSFPPNVQCLEAPISDKIITDDILWESQPVETEFTFVLTDETKQDLSGVYFTGALNISHGKSSVFNREPFLIIGEDSEERFGCHCYQPKITNLEEKFDTDSHSVQAMAPSCQSSNSDQDITLDLISEPSL